MENVKKQSVKMQIGTIVGLVIFVIITTGNVLSEKNKLEDRIIKLENELPHIAETANDNDNDIQKLEVEQQKILIQYAEISTKLTSIETSLAEIKAYINK